MLYCFHFTQKYAQKIFTFQIHSFIWYALQYISPAAFFKNNGGTDSCIETWGDFLMLDKKI